MPSNMLQPDRRLRRLAAELGRRAACLVKATLRWANEIPIVGEPGTHSTKHISLKENNRQISAALWEQGIWNALHTCASEAQRAAEWREMVARNHARDRDRARVAQLQPEPTTGQGDLLLGIHATPVRIGRPCVGPELALKRAP